MKTIVKSALAAVAFSAVAGAAFAADACCCKDKGEKMACCDKKGEAAPKPSAEAPKHQH